MVPGETLASPLCSRHRETHLAEVFWWAAFIIVGAWTFAIAVAAAGITPPKTDMGVTWISIDSAPGRSLTPPRTHGAFI
jgi:hypothetical protein